MRRFLGAKGDPYAKVGLDQDNRAGIDWGVYGVPETFIVKGDGKLAFKLVGPITAETLKARSSRRSSRRWIRAKRTCLTVALTQDAIGTAGTAPILLPELPHGQSHGLRIGLARRFGDDALVVQPHIGAAP